MATPHQPHQPRRPQVRGRGRGGVVVRAVAASVALLAGVVGPPWALLRFVGSPLPHGVPSVDEVLAALTQPPDPHLVLQGLAWVCWVAWAVFVLDVLAAAGQQLADHIRNRHDQHRAPARGGTWRPGALLIGVLIAAMLTISRPAPAGGAHGGGFSGSAAVIPVVHTLTTDTAPPAVSPAISAAVPRAAWPSRIGDRGGPTAGWVRVRAPEHGHHDSLWRIAERELGDGTRWSELYARNAGIPQADGRALVRPELIQPGWQLAVPTTAQQNGPSTTSPPRPHLSPTPPAPDRPGAPATPSPAEPTARLAGPPRWDSDRREPSTRRSGIRWTRLGRDRRRAGGHRGIGHRGGRDTVADPPRPRRTRGDRPIWSEELVRAQRRTR